MVGYVVEGRRSLFVREIFMTLWVWDIPQYFQVNTEKKRYLSYLILIYGCGRNELKVSSVVDSSMTFFWKRHNFVKFIGAALKKLSNLTKTSTYFGKTELFWIFTLILHYEKSNMYNLLEFSRCSEFSIFQPSESQIVNKNRFTLNKLYVNRELEFQITNPNFLGKKWFESQVLLGLLDSNLEGFNSYPFLDKTH